MNLLCYLPLRSVSGVQWKKGKVNSMYVVTNCPCFVNDDECRESSLIRQRCDNRTDCIIKKVIEQKRTDLFDTEKIEVEECLEL